MKRTKMQARRSPQRKTALRFSPYAWAKLIYLRDAGPTEVGAFGISASDDLLLVEELQLVQQVCTPVTVAFDDAAVADFFDEQVDRGVSPERCGRIWIHTHPCDSPLPSSTDERTLERSFAGPDWSVMFILARGGASYARMRFRAGPGGEQRLKVQVDYQLPFGGADQAAWQAEYEQCVRAHEGPGHLMLSRGNRLDVDDFAFMQRFLSGEGAPWW